MTGSLFWQILGWLALFINVLGNLDLTNKSVRGWVLRLACNLCWIAYSIDQKAWPLLVNHAVFVPINVRGWWKWRKRG